ncbi:MAG: sel1 repeat family protein [Chitinophagaceae bacterium]|nr:sel1 repeat family protein [Chitinophagaceae bacterium]MCW5926499.1 sel1 repeat family protein [Chitinophagaceae bacterium]
MIKYYIPLLLLLFVNHFAFAQNKDIEAKLRFTKAQDLYDQGGIENYMEAVKEVEAAEKLLGAPNLKTLYLKILAMHGVSAAYYFAYQKKEALDKFFELVKGAPDYPIEKYNKMLSVQEEAKSNEETIRKKGRYEKVFSKDFNGTEKCLDMEATLYYNLFFTDSTVASIEKRQEKLKTLQRIKDADKRISESNNYIDPSKYRHIETRRMMEEENKSNEYMNELAAQTNELTKKLATSSLELEEIRLQKNGHAKRFVYWQKQLTLHNATYALSNLSYCYAHGLGVLPNRQMAIEYKMQEYKLKSGVEAAGVAAGIGDLYKNEPIDLNWTPDYNKAIEWYKTAFNQAPDKYKSDAAFLIGKEYADNFTYPNAQAKLEAVKPWYELGGGAGILFLGHLYYSEHPSGTSKDATEKDNITAIEYYKKAANDNVIGAIESLATIYETGAPGIKKDKTKAKEYRAKAEALKKAK